MTERKLRALLDIDDRTARRSSEGSSNCHAVNPDFAAAAALIDNRTDSIPFDPWHRAIALCSLMEALVEHPRAITDGYTLSYSPEKSDERNGVDNKATYPTGTLWELMTMLVELLREVHISALPNFCRLVSGRASCGTFPLGHCR